MRGHVWFWSPEITLMSDWRAKRQGVFNSFRINSLDFYGTTTQINHELVLNGIVK